MTAATDSQTDVSTSGAPSVRTALRDAVLADVSPSLGEEEVRAVEWAATDTVAHWALYHSGNDDHGTALGDWFDPAAIRRAL